MGMIVAYLVYLARWEPLEKEHADTWLRKWMGEEAYTILWEPLLMSKFGPHYRNVNMAWMWARFKARTPKLGTFEGGFQAFLDALAEHVQSLGVDIRLRAPVGSIRPTPQGLDLIAGEETFQVDQCLVTTSPGLLAKLAPDLPKGYLGQLKNLKSMGAVVMVLVLTRRLSEKGVYWHNLPKSAGFPFLSLVEHTNFISPEFFGGDHIVYVGDYLEPEHEYFRLTKEELLEQFLPVFQQFNPVFDRSWVRESWLFRTPYAQPVPELNHSALIPDIRTPIEGLWLASMSQIYPWDRGTNFAVEIGRRAAREIIEVSKTGSTHRGG
jgi:protoporphyrinogen oxidase